MISQDSEAPYGSTADNSDREMLAAKAKAILLRETVISAIGGDESAFERLMEHFAPMLHGFLLGRLKHPEEAEDLLQEVFLRAHLKLETLRRPMLVGPWLVQIARNQLRDFYRRQSSQASIIMLRLDDDENDSRPEPADPGSSPMQRARDRELADAVLEVLKRMKERDRMIFYLRLMEEMEPMEIALQLNLKPSMVRMRLMRGLPWLRRELKAQSLTLE